MLLRRIVEHLKTQSWNALFLEFVIVVIGVFVGLQAQEWSAEREDRQRLERIITAFKADMADARRVESGFREDIQRGLAAFEDARRRGERPLPFFYQIRGSDTAPKLIWGTLQDAGLGELLDPHLLFELSHFYSERDGIGVKVTRYMESIESNVLPYVEGDPDYFYDSTSGKMRPEIKATMDRLREWAQYSAALGPWSECLEKRLETASESGASCRSWSYYDPASGEGLPKLTEAASKGQDLPFNRTRCYVGGVQVFNGLVNLGFVPIIVKIVRDQFGRQELVNVVIGIEN